MRAADYAIAAALMAVLVGCGAAMAAQSAHADEISVDWSWKVYPTDRVNTEALERIRQENAAEMLGGAVGMASGSASESLADAAASIVDYFTPEPVVEYYEPYYETYYAPSGPDYGNSFKADGKITSGGTEYSWYSQRVLPGGGLTELNANGRHVGDDGLIYDGDGYVAVASSDYAKGTVVDTPFGEGKVYDTGCDSGVIDIYTDF